MRTTLRLNCVDLDNQKRMLERLKEQEQEELKELTEEVTELMQQLSLLSDEEEKAINNRETRCLGKERLMVEQDCEDRYWQLRGQRVAIQTEQADMEARIQALENAVRELGRRLDFLVECEGRRNWSDPV